MPKLGLTMEEGTLVEWQVSPGESFIAGQVCAIIETDKILNDVQAPAAGRLVQILVQAGEVAAIGAPIAEWEPLSE